MPKRQWLFPGELPYKQKAFPGDCDDIRRQIASFLATKELTKAEFLRRCGAAIGKEGINSGSYAQFMARKGPDAGEDFGLYEAATAFFSLRRSTPSGAVSSATSSVPIPTKAEAAAKFAALCAELKDVEIPGEDIEDNAYDSMSCSVVRRRLNEYIGAHGITQSAMITQLGVNSNSWGKRCTSTFYSY